MVELFDLEGRDSVTVADNPAASIVEGAGRIRHVEDFGFLDAIGFSYKIPAYLDGRQALPADFRIAPGTLVVYVGCSATRHAAWYITPAGEVYSNKNADMHGLAPYSLEGVAGWHKSVLDSLASESAHTLYQTPEGGYIVTTAGRFARWVSLEAFGALRDGGEPVRGKILASWLDKCRKVCWQDVPEKWQKIFLDAGFAPTTMEKLDETAQT